MNAKHFEVLIQFVAFILQQRETGVHVVVAGKVQNTDGNINKAKVQKSNKITNPQRTTLDVKMNTLTEQIKYRGKRAGSEQMKHRVIRQQETKLDTNTRH